jgi:hypothetical protein
MPLLVRGDTAWLGACLGDRTKSGLVSDMSRHARCASSYLDFRVLKALLQPNGHPDPPSRQCSWSFYLSLPHSASFQLLTGWSSPSPCSSEYHSHIQHCCQCRSAADSCSTLESILTRMRPLRLLAHWPRIRVIVRCVGRGE